MRYQGFSNLGVVDEAESSVYVVLDRDPKTNLAIFCDCSNLPSLTRQEFADEADINNLMAKYEKTGILPTVNFKNPAFLDVSDVPDFQTALDFVAKAETAFMSLPARVRASFDNSAAQFINYAENPENLDQMRDWGLAPPAPVVPGPTKVEVINPSPAPSKGD